MPSRSSTLEPPVPEGEQGVVQFGLEGLSGGLLGLEQARQFRHTGFSVPQVAFEGEETVLLELEVGPNPLELGQQGGLFRTGCAPFPFELFGEHGIEGFQLRIAGAAAAEGGSAPGRVRGEGLHFPGILPGLTVLFGDGEPERLDLLGQGLQVLIEGIAVVADLGELAHWHAAGDKEDGQGHPHGRLTGHHDVKVAHRVGL